MPQPDGFIPVLRKGFEWENGLAGAVVRMNDEGLLLERWWGFPQLVEHVPFQVL